MFFVCLFNCMFLLLVWFWFLWTASLEKWIFSRLIKCSRHKWTKVKHGAFWELPTLPGWCSSCVCWMKREVMDWEQSPPLFCFFYIQISSPLSNTACENRWCHGDVIRVILAWTQRFLELFQKVLVTGQRRFNERHHECILSFTLSG